MSDMQRLYVAAREAYLEHKKACYRPGCGINAHGDGCRDERRLYEACRDALRERNAVLIRLQAFAARVTLQLEDAGLGLAWSDQQAARRAVLERELRAFVLSAGLDWAGPDVKAAWLDAPEPEE